MRLLLVLLLVGCASAGAKETITPRPAEPRPAPEEAAPPPEPVLSSKPGLAEVLQHAERVPLLAVSREAVAREEAVREQAGYWPNPVLGVKAGRLDLDDIGDGLGYWKVMVAQRFETAGKRGARVEAAGSRIEEAAGRERFDRLRVARAAAGAHQRAVAASRLVVIREEAHAAAKALYDLSAARVRAGRQSEDVLPPLAARVGRIQIDLDAIRLLERRALRDLEGILAVEPGSIEGVSGSLLADAIPLDAGDFGTNPEIETLKAAEEVAASGSEEARAKAWPDFTLGLEYEQGRLREDSFARMVSVFIEVPLPLFDRNQGGKAASLAEARGSRAATRAAEARIAADYREAREVVITLAENRRTWTETVLPAMERERDLAAAAFGAGRTDREATLVATLKVVEARSELVAIESALADAVLDALALRGLDPARWLTQ